MGRSAYGATALALLFVFLSLLALALVPSYLERSVQHVSARIRDVLEPAERLAAEIESSYSRQVEAYQSFLLTGDPRARLRYREARQKEEGSFSELRPLTEDMDLEVRERVYDLFSLAFNWHLGHQEMLSQEALPGGAAPDLSDPAFRERLALEQSSYQEVLAASGALREALARERARGEASVARARAQQVRITRALVGLGLAATLVTLLLGWHLSRLMAESEERRREALRARREADALLRATADGVIGMDRQGRCTFLNRAGAELLGYSTRLVAGRDVHDLLHHSRPDGTPYLRSECPIVRALERGEAITGMGETLWAAGRRPFPVQLSLRPLRDGEEVKGAVLTFTDMTETRAAEESLRRAVQARDEVLAVVSHDLRNPVGTVYTTASLLLEMEFSEEKRREHLRGVKRSAERMNRLIQDLLDVTRLEAGALPLAPTRFSVPEVVDEVVVAHRARAEEKGVRLRGRVGEALREGWGDRHRVVQILTNLVENALRHTPSGGEVTVAAEEETGGAVRFSVEDTGAGISEEDQVHLFDRFWQVKRRGKGGAGLGLSIVKGLVEAHGGRIGLRSREGEGSLFWFTLPGEGRGSAGGEPAR